eukprot:COSAG02_NODE_31_length_50774_cov_1928.118204_29_plen_93_part_00
MMDCCSADVWADRVSLVEVAVIPPSLTASSDAWDASGPARATSRVHACRTTLTLLSACLALVLVARLVQVFFAMFVHGTDGGSGQHMFPVPE